MLYELILINEIEQRAKIIFWVYISVSFHTIDEFSVNACVWGLF